MNYTKTNIRQKRKQAGQDRGTVCRSRKTCYVPRRRTSRGGEGNKQVRQTFADSLLHSCKGTPNSSRKHQGLEEARTPELATGGDTRLQGDSIATENSLLGNGYPQMFCISAPFQAFRGSSGCYQGTTSISRNSITVTSVPMFPHDANECLPPGL